MLALHKFAVLASLLLLPACARNEPAKAVDDAKQSVKDKAVQGSNGSQADSLKSMKELDGAWQLVEVEFGPNVAGEEALKGTTFVVKDGKYTINGQHIHSQGTFEIDGAAKPHTITIFEAEATEVGETIKYGEKIKKHGIVRVEGDKLEMRFTTADKALPIRFVPSDGETTYYFAKRLKE